MKKLLPCFAGLLLGTAASLHADNISLANLDFESPQYPSNFRVLNANGATLTQTSNGGANDFMTSTGGSGASIVYDANGSSAGVSSFTVDAGHPLTISADVRFTSTNNSFGIYIINRNNEAQGYLAIFNVNFSGTSDQIRFSSNAAPTTSGAGTLVAGSFANNADTGFSTVSGFGSISVTYSINGSNNPVLTMTAGSQTSSIAFTAISSPFTDVEVGFRFGSGAPGVISMDNLSISTIPEPSTFAIIAGAAVLGAVVTRRRIVR